MAVLREVNAARHIHRHIGVELRDAFRIEHFGGNAEAVRLLREGGFMVKRLLCLAQHHQPFLHEVKVIVRQGGQFLETGAAGKTQIANQWRAALHMLRIRRAHELPSP